MSLRVELYGEYVGDVHGDNRGGIAFHADNSSYPIGSRIMSLSVPLIPVRRRKGVSSATPEAHANFFESLLPQGESLKNIAYQKNLSEKDTYGLLRAIGRDVAGALQIFDPEDPYEQPEPYLQPVSSDEVRSLLNSRNSEPLGNAPVTGMMSLGGYQNKVMLSYEDGQWNRAHNGAATTHIIKPHSKDEQLEGIIYCEAYGLDLAREAGVLGYKSWIEDFGGEDALVIERFDRELVDGKIERIHQENALQALGLPDIAKYEMQNNGKISLKMFAKLLRPYAGKQAQIDLLGTMVVNTAIGNLDAHAGNLGVMHHRDGSIAFAPAYDMVVNSLYNPAGEHPLALFIDGEYKHRNISRKELINEGVSWGIKENQVAAIVDEKIERLEQAFSTVDPHPSIPEEAFINVGNYITNLREGRPVGKAKVKRDKSSVVAPVLPVPSGPVTAPTTDDLCLYPVASAGNAPCKLKFLHDGHHRSR